MNNIWLTSDTHFNHDKDFIWKKRGFKNVQEMNETLVKNWNEYVHSDDIVYHLGDICLGDNTQSIKYINRLNGNIHWITGNHDTKARIDYIFNNCHNIIDVTSFATIIKYGKLHIYLSHFPTYTANFDDNKHFSRHLLNLHGHTHAEYPFFDISNPYMYNVGVDAHDCHPVHIDEVINDIIQFSKE